MDDATVFYQREEMREGVLHWTGTSSEGNYNSRSETEIALMVYA